MEYTMKNMMQRNFDLNALMRLLMCHVAVGMSPNHQSYVAIITMMFKEGHLPDELASIDAFEVDWDPYLVEDEHCCDLHAINIQPWAVDGVCMLTRNKQYPMGEIDPEAWFNQIMEAALEMPIDGETKADLVLLATRTVVAMKAKGDDHWNRIRELLRKKVGALAQHDKELETHPVFRIAEELRKMGADVQVVKVTPEDLAGRTPTEEPTKH